MKKSQLEVVKARLLKHKQVSTIWAVEHYILRLSAIIFVLRKDGIDIKTMPIRNKTNPGATANYVLSGLTVNFLRKNKNLIESLSSTNKSTK